MHPIRLQMDGFIPIYLLSSLNVNFLLESNQVEVF